MVAAEEPLSVLLEQARHRVPQTRLRAVRALGRTGAGEAVVVLEKILDDPDAKVREAAAAAIGQIGAAALPQLGGMLSHPDKYIRRHAVWALAKLGRQATPLRQRLCQMLKDDDPRTASGAAQALGALGDSGSDAVPALAEAMRGTNIVLCRMAAKALSQIGRPALPTLVNHLKHHDPFVRSEAAVALGWIGPKAGVSVPVLVEVLRTTTMSAGSCVSVPVPGMAGTPPTSVTSKQSELSNSLESARINAAQALGRIGAAARSAIPALEIASMDQSEAVRDAAERSLRQIRAAI